MAKVNEITHQPLNEAGIDVKANELLGYGVLNYDTTHRATPLAAAALNGDRRALRKLIKNAIREAAI